MISQRQCVIAIVSLGLLAIDRVALATMGLISLLNVMLS
jgi:hypothetical protein